jgi:hypothetical protein
MPARYPDQFRDTTASPERSEQEPEPEPALADTSRPDGYYTFQPEPVQHAFQPEPASTTGSGPALTFDPNFIWERPGSLDPSLDPSFGRPVGNNGDISLALSHRDRDWLRLHI